ncbi:hypothetical protein ON010_g5650 [Phytophthora cinnamomi]|nr:hypothetical protein ON010_g5650 [Phytophthora cinnamomi]
MELAKMLDPADEWIQRSPSYQAVGARGVEALRRSGERQRWDTLGHFGSRYVSSGIACIPVELRQRLEGQHSFWKKAGSTPRSDNGDEVNRALDAGKNIGNQQQRDTEVYAELQARIRERLIANERRTRTAAAAVRAVGASSKTQQLLPQTAPAKLMVTSTSAVSLPAGGSIPSRENQLQNPGSPSLALGMSASEPVLPVDTTMGADFTTPATDTQSLSPQRRSQLGTRGRLSVLEQKILVNPSQPISRHGRRKESLIGAPRAQLDTNAIGRHSEARIAYRRDTAQTWAWHLPPGAASGNAVGMIAEEENNEDKDRFDEEGDQCDGEDNSEEGEDGEDGTEYGDDDVESVDSSRTSFSARSSMSMSSVKRRTGSGNKRSGKSKRPPVLQRRASRGPGGRSAGNTLTGHALSLHARLEVIWRVLQFPFSNKLAMLERLSTIQDADVFLSALEHWERVTPLVAIRQRMKLALSGFAERGELRPNEWLTTSEFALVAALSQSSSRNLPEPSSEAISPFKASIREFDSMSPSAFVAWVRLD